MIYLSNAFSLQMLPLTNSALVQVEPVNADEVKGVEYMSCIGHADTAAVLADMLGKEVGCNRVSVSLTHDDILYVAQIVGGRLPEGSTTLPEGFKIKFIKVTLQKAF